MTITLGLPGCLYWAMEDPIKGERYNYSILLLCSFTNFKCWSKPQKLNVTQGKSIFLRDCFNMLHFFVLGIKNIYLCVWEHWDGLKNMHVSSLPKLMAIKVISKHVINSIKIEASKLESLLFYLMTYTMPNHPTPMWKFKEVRVAFSQCDRPMVVAGFYFWTHTH
jgi:hypothetical protein